MDRMSTPTGNAQGKGIGGALKWINQLPFSQQVIVKYFRVEIKEFVLFGNRWTFFMCVLFLFWWNSHISLWRRSNIFWSLSQHMLQTKQKSSGSQILGQILMLYWDRGRDCVSHVIISSHIGGDWELLVEIWTTFISNVTTLFITPHTISFLPSLP